MVRLVLLVLCVGACDEDPCPDGSMLDSPEALVVTEEEHPLGWGEADCAACHARAVLHRRGCSEVDMRAVRREVAREGTATCTVCHGDNGGLR